MDGCGRRGWMGVAEEGGQMWCRRVDGCGRRGGWV